MGKFNWGHEEKREGLGYYGILAHGRSARRAMPTMVSAPPPSASSALSPCGQWQGAVPDAQVLVALNARIPSLHGHTLLWPQTFANGAWWAASVFVNDAAYALIRSNPHGVRLSPSAVVVGQHTNIGQPTFIKMIPCGSPRAPYTGSFPQPPSPPPPPHQPPPSGPPPYGARMLPTHGLFGLPGGQLSPHEGVGAAVRSSSLLPPPRYTAPSGALCQWRSATTADVLQDGTAPRYQQLLNTQPVGFQVIETHNGRTWMFVVCSGHQCDPPSNYVKDVRGYVCGGPPPNIPPQPPQPPPATPYGYHLRQLPTHGLFGAPGVGGVQEFQNAASDLVSQVVQFAKVGSDKMNAQDYIGAVLAFRMAGQNGATGLGPEIDAAGAPNVTQPFTHQAWVLNGVLQDPTKTGDVKFVVSQGHAFAAQQLVGTMIAYYATAITQGSASLNAPPPPLPIPLPPNPLPVPPAPPPMPPDVTPSAAAPNYTVPILLGAGLLGVGIVGWALFARPTARAVRAAAEGESDEARRHAHRAMALHHRAIELREEARRR